VPIHPEQKSARVLTSVNISRPERSVLEAAVGQPIVYFKYLRLTGWLLAPKGEEADLVLTRIHFPTNQAVGPYLTQWPGLAQEGRLAVAVIAPPVNQTAPGPLLQVELPAGGEGTPVWVGLDPRRLLVAAGLQCMHQAPQPQFIIAGAVVSADPLVCEVGGKASLPFHS
jgi:hypothetical protein